MSLRRSIWLLVALVVVQLFLVSSQLSDAPGEPPLLHRAAVVMVSPIAVAVDATGNLLAGLGDGLATRSRVMEENERLRATNERLSREALQRLESAGELERLRAAVEYERAWGGDVTAADVVYVDHDSWLQSALIRVGEGRARFNQVVVAGDALLGRVVVPVGPYAKIQLVTDRTFGVAVMIERTRRQGVLKGSGRAGLRLDYIPTRSDLVVGDRLVTAGIDGIYPRGLPVGTVRAVEAQTDQFYRVEVTPAVDFSRLDQVLLLAPSAVPEEAIEAELDEAPEAGT